MFKVSYDIARKRHQTSLSREEYDKEMELNALEDKLSPRPKQEFGQAIKESTSYCNHSIGKFISKGL